MSETNQTVVKLVNEFESHFDEIRVHKSSKENKKISICKAALTKSFEFVQLSVSNSDKNEFFYLSSLRGICEELIALTYINEKLTIKEIEDLVEFKYVYEQEKDLLKQFDFFFKYKTIQPIVPPKTTKIEDELFDRIRKDEKGYEVKKIAQEKGIKTLPKTWLMAKETGYTDLYQFLYSITSASVHFRIDNFQKIGWGELDKYKRIENVIYSTQHEEVNRFCKEFNICYGILLFAELSAQLKSVLNLNDEYLKLLDKLIELIKNNRWPEFITRQHMNLSEDEVKEKYLKYVKKYAI